MKVLDKESRNYILELIKERASVIRIIAFCDGYGLDTTKYSSPVHYGNGKLTIRYRNKNTYYYI